MLSLQFMYLHNLYYDVEKLLTFQVFSELNFRLEARVSETETLSQWLSTFVLWKISKMLKTFLFSKKISGLKYTNIE